MRCTYLLYHPCRDAAGRVDNTLVYTRPIATWTDRLERLRAQWLPYYGEELRRARLTAAAMYARNDLAHISPFSHRGLCFQCLKRLHHALGRDLAGAIHRRAPLPYRLRQVDRRASRQHPRMPNGATCCLGCARTPITVRCCCYGRCRTYSRDS
jgi:hypothetical protein